MHPSTAPIVLLSGLSAMATALELTADEVPLNCFNMCGPIVELTGICNVGNPHLRRVKRRDLEIAPRSCDQRVKTDELQLRVRQIAIPPPGNFAAQTTPSSAALAAPARQSVPTFRKITPTTTLNLRVTAAPTRIFPIIVQPTTAAGLSAAALSSSVVASPTPTPSPPLGGINMADVNANANGDDVDVDDAITSMVLGAAMPADGDAPATLSLSMDGTTWAYEKQILDMEEAAEAECICLNESFDVRSIAALCAACIIQEGDFASTMNMVMGECNFTSTTYEPFKTSLANDIRVAAARPTVAVAGSGAMGAGSLARKAVTGLAGAVAFGALCGAFVLF